MQKQQDWNPGLHQVLGPNRRKEGREVLVKYCTLSYVKNTKNIKKRPVRFPKSVYVVSFWL